MGQSFRSNKNSDRADELRATGAGNAKARSDSSTGRFGPADIQGFELSINGDDIDVAMGLIDGVAVAAVTLDVSALALGDGTHDIVFDGTTVTAEAQVSGRNVKLGEFVESSAAASSVSLAGRGLRGQVSTSI